MNLLNKPSRLLSLVLIALILVACQEPETGDEPTLSDAGPTQATVQSTPPLTATMAPTATAMMATPAPLVSTPTIAADVEPTVTPEPTPTEAIPGLIGPDNFPDDVNPLTGETVADTAVLQHRPIAIKVSNYPPVVRPQAGLNNADLVFEHYAEGGVTRFTAVFYGNDARPIGSIRSGRLIDLEIPKMYDAAFAYSGSSGPVRLMLRDSPFFDRIISPDFAHGGFYRVEDPSKAFEHTLFTDTPRLRAILEERGVDRPPQFNTNMAFSEFVPEGGVPAATIEIRYIGTNAFWRYDPIIERYRRSTDGAAHLDANTGNQLSFKNVIVVSANHVDTDILEDNVGGGHYSIQIQLWGEGPATIFRDGLRFEGYWRRELAEDMLTFYDQEGNVLPLAIGNSFFELVPLGFEGLVVNP